MTELPDKIYIRHYWVLGELDDKWRLRSVEDEICEEYIRKDTLLEWVKEMNESCKGSILSAAYATMINKIKSL